MTRILAVLGAVLVSVLACAGSASAHAVLVDSKPDGYAVLDSAPSEVTLRFSEPVEAGLAEVGLVGPDGADITGISRPTAAPESPEILEVQMPDTLARGTYTVSYRVVSADSHPVQGAFAFSIGEVTGGVTTDTNTSTADEGGAVLSGAARWAGFVGLALLIGTAFFGTACWPGGAASTGVRRLAWAGWGLLTVSTAGTLLTYHIATGSPSFEATVTSRTGVLLAVRLALLVFLIGVLVQVLRSPTAADGPWHARYRRAAVVILSGAALATTWSLGNHSVTGSQAIIAVPSDMVHLVAMGVWLGALPALFAVLLRSGDTEGMRAAIPRFSRVALVCVALLLVTGTYQAWRQVGSPSALFGTTYGGLLLAKTGLVAILVTLGAVARNWVRTHYQSEIVTVSDRRRARRGPTHDEVVRFRRTVVVEAVIATAVLGVTAGLVGVEPARVAYARAAEPTPAPERTGPVNVVVPFDAGGDAHGRGQLAVTVAPGAVGRNEIHLIVLGQDGRPASVREVHAEFGPADQELKPLPVKLRAVGPGHFIAQEASIPMPGQWELAVTIRTSDVDQDVLRIPVGAR